MFATNNTEQVRTERPPVRAPRKAAAKRAGDRTAQAPRILIVEDEIFVAWHLESVLSDLDYRVCGLVPDGEDAVAKVNQLEADLVLMDINLKGNIDGIEAARRIREQRATPIIFITAHGDPATRARIEQALPGTPVLAKPITAERLKEAIASVMK
jgi:CheY-like chemotaxis protein